jgi:lipopolysaccharide biosynthesis glycosyltransferase
MNILVTLNSNYIKPLKVMLTSMFLNNEKEDFDIYLMHSSISEEELEDLDYFLQSYGQSLHIITIDSNYFQDAPVVKHYTKEMYYRILAYKFLPREMEKILYLDPDILVINSIRKLYDTDISNYLYAAAYHNRVSVKEINKLRLLPYDIDAYYNSGVMLMNVKLQREKIKEDEIYEFVKENKLRLILPDQDIINALFSKQIKEIDEVLYNYDARFHRYYKMMSNGKYDMDFVMRNSAIIHFCGKKKPWNKNYTGKFHSLYKHYERITFPD